MDLADLKIFSTLCGTLNFTQAAASSSKSVSAVTRAVQRLESELGCQLFVRSPGKVEITPAGERAKAFADATLSAWRRLKKDTRPKERELSGQLRVFCSVTASYFVLPPLLSEFRKRYPKVEIRLETGDAALAVGKVLSGAADLAVAARPDESHKGLRFRKLVEIPLVFIAGNGDLQCESADEWIRMPIILPERGTLRSRLDEWYSDRGIVPDVYAEVAGNEAIVSMVALGCGIGVVPRAVVERSPVASSIAVLPIKPELRPFEVSLCVSASRSEDLLVSAFWSVAGE